MVVKAISKGSQSTFEVVAELIKTVLIHLKLVLKNQILRDS